MRKEMEGDTPYTVPILLVGTNKMKDERNQPEKLGIKLS
jgi:hypothetical protein